MDQTLLVFILSVLVFVLGAVFINVTVKREEAAKKAEDAKAVTVMQEPTQKAA